MSKNLFALILIGAFALEAFATSQFQTMLEKDLGQKSKESTVYIDGVQYQKIEIENDTYYLSFKGRKTDTPKLFCERPTGWNSEKLIEGSVKIKKRKAFYFNLLKESCVAQNGQIQSVVNLSPELGIFLPESPGDAIKNKKVGINPLDPSGVNFSGEW